MSQPTERVITIGVPKSPGIPVVPRLELRTFLEDKDLTNLWILAIDRMQKTSQDEPTSWYRVASIHGRPYESWNDVEGNDSGTKECDGKGRSGGYCTHSSILFPSWHRPYLALFEQTLWDHAFAIAHEYRDPVDKDRYISAAKRFRIPYWDWALHPELPSIVAVDEKVTVYTPYGTHSIKNPLFSYEFHPVYDHFGDGGEDEKKWESWESTLRYPANKDVNAKSQPGDMQKELELKRQILRDKVYILLTQTKKYTAFSNDSFIEDQSMISYNNIESIHNDIHGFAGGDGHMGAVDYAAFDPIFWLHHANVDRLFAIWQALNPDEYVTCQKNEAGTWTREPGAQETAQSPLTPFRAPPSANENHCSIHPANNSDRFWNSDGVRCTHAFNYTYPELKRWPGFEKWHERTDEEVAQRNTNLHTDIIQLYGSPVVERLLDAYYDSGKQLEPLAKTIDIVQNSASTHLHAPKNAEITIVGKDFEEHQEWHNTPDPKDDKLHYHEWIVNIRVKKYEVNASFQVLVFLGQPKNSRAEWSLDPNLVGSQVIFANNVEFTGCARCRTEEAKGQRVTGTIPLTNFLGDRLREKNLQLEPKQIIPYLKQNFTWKVLKLDGTPIDAEVPSLKITIGHALVEVPDPDSARAVFPKWVGPGHV